MGGCTVKRHKYRAPAGLRFGGSNEMRPNAICAGSHDLSGGVGLDLHMRQPSCGHIFTGYLPSPVNGVNFQLPSWIVIIKLG